MWHKIAEVAQQSINRSGAKNQVEAERIISLANSIGKGDYQATSFRQGLLVIVAKDADPVELFANQNKITNTLNKILKEKIILRVRVLSS